MAMFPDSPDSLVPAVQRTLALLEILRTKPEGVTLQELLGSLDISRSSLFALLNTLKQLGYVEQAERRGSYRPGPRLQAWQQPALFPQQDQLASFYHEAGMSGCDETLALAVPVADGNLVIAQVESPQRVRSVYRIGDVYEPDACAAFSVLQAPTTTVMELGYARREDAESVELALPICRDGSHPDAALLLSAPVFRCDEAVIEHKLPQLREMAARLSYRLGASAYMPYRQRNPADLPPAIPMQANQIDTFLRGPWTARLACLRADQTPHVVPVWQEWDGKHFYIVAWRGSQWVDYVLAQPQVSLAIDEPWPPLRRVTARGMAYPLAAGDFDYDRLLRNLRHRYLGAWTPTERDLPVTHAFRIVPETLRGWQGIPS
ncbi:MAG: helix-turn-helix domain-containing protein [Anaerolineae bacterium]|nr:helix-turn-helix domain-containing protein [Anaerolineae bacterium]